MIKVSVVEDVAIMRTTLKSIIDGDPELIWISEHETVDEAMHQLPFLNPDIVLMDINLNGKNGIDVIKKVKKLKPDIQFLMCTVFQDDDKIFESLKAGATGYILKKSSGNEITEAIKCLFEGGSPMSAEIARRVVQSFKTNGNNELDDLTIRETELLKLISEGLTYKECAEQLLLSPATVRNRLHHIYGKLQVKNKTEAVNKYLKG